jgi:hypothetical protein
MLRTIYATFTDSYDTSDLAGARAVWTRPRLEWADSSKACLYRFVEQH